jgi:hypothetical protein
VDKSQPWVFDFIVSTAGTFDVVGTTDEILSIAKVRSLVTCDLRQHLDERYPDTPVLVRDTSLHEVPLSTEDPRELE